MRIAILGTGALAREVAALALDQVGAEAADVGEPVVFVPRDAADVAPLAGHSLRALAELEDDRELVIAVGDPALRRRIAEGEAAGRRFATVMADTARRRGRSDIGEGAVLCDGVVVTDDVRIGRHFLANPHACVMHDCVIGDFVTLAPGAIVNGNVEIGDGAYIGAGAVIKQGAPGRAMRIGPGAVVGMGAVVTRDVPAGETVVGNPARPLKR
ncbi:MAG TPA: acetyltransferase [Brevundimonas sp.]|jgi:sugar O-acyltransferase (sialic acid O-acetyltransferase NeuD family)|uniref:acetyltransferase n=1 Tax=Brevundimonas sp. TaxID=1871086 RepID=UPI002DE6D8FA|nr:acetyltransferase [Brevundimonas sp.]